MRILLMSATKAEIEPFLRHFQSVRTSVLTQETYHLKIDQFLITAVISGPGMMNMAFHTAMALFQQPFQIAIQAGIAGSFSKDITLGEVVQVTSEQIADLGAEDNDKFIPIAQMPFFHPNEYPYQNGILYNQTQPELNLPETGLLKKVKGITVNTVSGNSKTIELRQNLFHPDVETMEGASFFYACLKNHSIPFSQIRSISNYIEPRNTDNWKIPLAIESLNGFLIHLFGPK